MTHLLVVSDTHLREGQDLPEEITQRARDSAAIVHLGDFVDPAVADSLQALGHVYAVHGNCDPPELCSRFPARQTLDIAGKRIVLLHGHLGGRTALDAARAVIGADVVLFGHSHQPTIERMGDTLLFNPGSPTQRRFAPHRTYGLLDLTAEPKATIVALD